MEKMYKLIFKWSEDEENDGNLRTFTEEIAVSSSKEELIDKVYEWFEERDENADDFGKWDEDKSSFYCFLDECLIDTEFIIEEVDFLK